MAVPMNRFAVCVAPLVACLYASALTLEDGFRNPPGSARPHVWYHMMNGNVTKEGITCDFEALAKAGIGGVQIFDVTEGMPRGKLAFNTPEWFDMMRHAAEEARRLGLEIAVANCSGWSSSGGPWNVPSNAMKRVVFTETAAHGPGRFSAKLPRTQRDGGYYEDIAVLAFPAPPADAAAFPGVAASYTNGVATLSSPEPFTVQGVSFRLSFPEIWSADGTVTVEFSEDGERFEKLEKFQVRLARSGARDLSLRYRLFKRKVSARAIRLSASGCCKVAVAELRPEGKMRIQDLAFKTFATRGRIVRRDAVAADDQVVQSNRIVNLTARLEPDGSIDWEIPEGNWIILRIGAACNSACNFPATGGGVGLEVDKLSASALDGHFNAYLARLCDSLGPLAGDVDAGLNGVLVDSYEVGCQNWTRGLAETFKARLGYSMLPYLPVFTGRVVNGMEESERFLEDFRRVIADLFAENYAGRLAALCHGRGLKLHLEPYGNGPSDNLRYGSDVDVPMGEFWAKVANGDRVTNVGNARFPAYLAHVWGRRYAAAEAFTSDPSEGGRWLTTPFSIKAQCDRAYADGVNRIVYHRFVHQPWTGGRYLPGMTMGRWGMHLDRTQTWWHLAGDWFSYQSRCQWMLQEGVFVADALFFCGEQAPNEGGNAYGGDAGSMSLPRGYAWDICSADAMERLRVEKGRIVSPGGVAYSLLVLPASECMGTRMLNVVEGLVDAGAKVCCRARPSRVLGLAGYPKSDDMVRVGAARIWRKGVMDCSPMEALKRLGIEPDFSCEVEGAAYIHRRSAGCDWYFVALPNAAQRTFEASFRISGFRPEIWDAENGTISDAREWRTEGGRTTVSLDFPPSGSAFVVFRRSTGEPGHSEPPAPKQEMLAEVTGSWYVTFPVDWYSGGLAIKSFNWPSLRDWTADEDPDVRYFSGTAKYAKTVHCDPLPGARVWLDLGKVGNFAVARVNGRTFPVLWRPPFRVDITDALIPGEGSFSLEVEVTNLWPNRLIGDDALCPEDCEWKEPGRKGVGIKSIPQWVRDGLTSPTGRRTFTTWKHWDRSDRLLPSGLLGPVTLRTCGAARAEAVSSSRKNKETR